MHDEFRRSVYLNLGSIIGSMVVFGIAFYFLTNDILAQSAEIAKNRILMQRSAEAVEMLATVKQSIPTVQRYTTIMNRLLPDQLQLLNLQPTLATAARLQQVTLRFTPGDSQTDPGDGHAGRVPFSINISGPLQNILRFMKNIESDSQDFLLSLDSFDLKRADATTYEITAPGTAFFK